MSVEDLLVTGFEPSIQQMIGEPPTHALHKRRISRKAVGIDQNHGALLFMPKQVRFMAIHPSK